MHLSAKLRAEGGTVRLNQLEMAALFDTPNQNIGKHIKAIFADGELSGDAVVNLWLTTAADGKKYRVCEPSKHGVGVSVQETFKLLKIDEDYFGEE